MLEESSRQPQLPPALCGPFASKDALKAALVLHDPQRRSLRTVIGQSNKHRVALYCCDQCTVLVFSFASSRPLSNALHAVLRQRNIAQRW